MKQFKAWLNFMLIGVFLVTVGFWFNYYVWRELLHVLPSWVKEIRLVAYITLLCFVLVCSFCAVPERKTL